MSGVSGTVQGYNLFAYCFNNPVNMSDSTGNWPRWVTAVVAVAAVVVGVAALATGNLPLAATAGKVAIAATATYALQTVHYDVRKELNNIDTLPTNPKAANDLDWQNSKPISNNNPNGGGPAANCHQYTSPNNTNVKWVSPDGHREVIYNADEEIVANSLDVGTYNFVPSGGFLGTLGHIAFDILPWVVFGNDDADPGPIVTQIIYLFE